MKYLKLIGALIVIFVLLKESGAFSNLLPNFTSVCLGSFLLPEDQRITVNSVIDWQITREPDSLLKSMIRSIPTVSCFAVTGYYANRKVLVFTTHPSSGSPPTIYSVYAFKTMKYLWYLELPLAKGANGDLKPLENLTELENLNLSYDDQKLDLSPIKNLKKLKSLHIKKSANGVSIDFNSLLAELPNLKSLSIEDPDFVDINSISNFQNLERLYLTTNPSADFTPLLNLKRLTVLRIYEAKGSKCPNFPKDICYAHK